MASQSQDDGLAQLCCKVKELIPPKLGDEAWYLLIVRLPHYGIRGDPSDNVAGFDNQHFANS